MVFVARLQARLRGANLRKRYYYWPVADRTKTQWHYPAANGAKPARTESRLEVRRTKRFGDRAEALVVFQSFGWRSFSKLDGLYMYI